MPGSLKNIEVELKVLKNCRICPHECGANRFKGPSGYCRTGAGYYISSVVIHKGEEPIISGTNGICNVFFAHCNIQCCYCQNYQISRNTCLNAGREWTLNEIVNTITGILDSGIENVGFVSPSHMVPQLKSIIFALNLEGYSPTIVYNTNAYDKIETLRSLENLVDVYLPDFKYSDPELAQSWSDAGNYPPIASKAIKEMYRQKGNLLHLNKKGKLDRGMIVRHLVLPGAVQNSIDCLRFLATEVSDRIAVSLMSQYSPIYTVAGNPLLNRRITKEEYSQVVEEMNKLGFTKGWIQELDSPDYYNPDFSLSSPFEA
jgi:putative pyruvate formate lyase activating enzyme